MRVHAVCAGAVTFRLSPSIQECHQNGPDAESRLSAPSLRTSLNYLSSIIPHGSGISRLSAHFFPWRAIFPHPCQFPLGPIGGNPVGIFSRKDTESYEYIVFKRPHCVNLILLYALSTFLPRSRPLPVGEGRIPAGWGFSPGRTGALSPEGRGHRLTDSLATSDQAAGEERARDRAYP